MIQCLVCGQEISSYKGMSSHLRSKHSITNQQYYDKYLKEFNEGRCLVCSKPTRFYGLIYGYAKCCSTQCANKCEEKGQHISEAYHKKSKEDIDASFQKQKETMLKKYGVDHPMHSQQIVNKLKQTNQLRYNSDFGFGNKDIQQKSKQTKLEKYGSTTYNNRTKAKQTCIDKYSVSNPYQISQVQQNMLNNTQSVEVKQKRHGTKLKNGWNRSRLEEYLQNKLIDLGYEFEHNYLSDLYPWHVDFYIYDLDLYIEINNFWTHNNHFYDESKDKSEKLDLIEKSKISKLYEVELKTWTISDIRKRDHAKKNYLNYVVLWNENQIKLFLKDLAYNKSFNGFIDYNRKEII